MIFLQPCELQETNPKGSKMLCRMPVMQLPEKLIKEVEQSKSGAIDGSQGPGVASYISSDGSVRVDVFIGLKLDAFKLYQNINAVHPSFKMQFALEPLLFCPEVTEFDPSNSNFITIQVEIFLHFCCYIIILSLSLCIRACLFVVLSFTFTLERLSQI